MWKRNFFILAILSLTFVGTGQAQQHSDVDTKIAASNKKPRGKAKPVTTAHDRYANQEVSYRQSAGNEVAVESLDQTKPKGTGRQMVFEPNNEPLWAKAKQTPTAKTRNARARKGVVVVEVPVNAKKTEGESNTARKKEPKKPSHTQNLLPYMEQGNVYKTNKPKTPRKRAKQNSTAN